MDLIAKHRELVGERIKSARNSAKLTLDQLAEKTGSSRQHLIRIEKGRHTPTAQMLQRVADATGQDVSFFNVEADGDKSSDEDDEESDPLSLDELLRRRVQAEIAAAMRQLRAEAQA